MRFSFGASKCLQLVLCFTSVTASLIQEAEAIVGWNTDHEIFKKRILPNLYGFDIEPEAIEIARLRLWLSLISDQKEPDDAQLPQEVAARLEVSPSTLRRWSEEFSEFLSPEADSSEGKQHRR